MSDDILGSLLTPKNNNISFETEWAKTLPVVRNLLHKENVSKKDWQDMFTTNNRIAAWVANGCDRLLSELGFELLDHVTDAAKNIHAHNDDDSLLRAYIQEWENYSQLCRYLPLPFNFIEKYLAKTPSRPRTETQKVRNVMLEYWNGYVFADISQRLLNAAMGMVERERNRELVNSQLIIGVRESFVELNVEADDPLQGYEERFERSYIKGTEQFYKSRTAQLLKQDGVLNYMVYVDGKLAEEEERAKRYLDSSSSDSIEKLVEECVQVLVIEYQDQLLAIGPILIKNNEVTRLKTLYRLINRTNAIPTLLDILHKHITAEGLAAMHEHAAEIVTDSERYVEQLLNMYSVFSALVRDAFYNDSRFLTVRDKAFQEVVNNTEVFRLELDPNRAKGGRPTNIESKCPELLANYCDLLLRKSALTKKFSSEEIDERLNNVLLVLKYVTAKDVFMRYHKTHLSRRLILELVADQEKEEMLVSKFREAGMPVDFVNKLFRMLQDIEVNKDLNSALRKSLEASNCGQMADCANVKILNAGAWSRSRDQSHLTLPRELEDLIPEVEDFYKKQHCGRKLNWAHHWSTGTVSFTNKAGKFDLEVTTHQMAILFCWNDRPNDKISFETIRLATELSEGELARSLLSLVSFPKVRMRLILCELSQQPLTPKSFNDSTLFWLNQEFCLIKNDKPQSRGRINLIGRLQLNQDAGIEQEHEEILQLRTFRVQEAIVKIMKTRKKLNQAQLQTELVDVLLNMFLPSRKLIKEQIEWLIEQKFLKRDDRDMNTFIYLV
uniref:Cullin-5 n=1 Tax=Globodera rostochiensis TaxID=31243 RepID=A0A914HHC4_GLORO